MSLVTCIFNLFVKTRSEKKKEQRWQKSEFTASLCLVMQSWLVKQTSEFH